MRSNKAQAMLSHLTVEPVFAPKLVPTRESLMLLLWPDMPDVSARKNLRQTTYLLNKAIPEVDGPDSQKVPFILSDRQAVRINPAGRFTLDVAEMVRLASESSLVALKQAAALYQGELLADFYLDDSNEFEEWAAARRILLNRTMMQVLETITMRFLSNGDFDQAEVYARRQLEIAPHEGSGHRHLMEALAGVGNRHAALEHFERYRAWLENEIGVRPATETLQLMEAIRAGKITPAVPDGLHTRGYEFRERIGEGGFGTVYRAYQPAVDREVAIKVIRHAYADDPQFIQRFEAEARLIARLEHPHIVPLYDYWQDASGTYLVMRWIRGGSLEKVLADQSWSLQKVGILIEQIASALDLAHRQGIVHRDIKPANILLDDQGNAYLTDFGIARELLIESKLTRSGVMVGSPYYISPEQLNGEVPSAQSDIYSLGLMLYELITGEYAFKGASLGMVVVKHLNEPVPLMRENRPDLPEALEEVVQRATAKIPADRYQHALEMAAAVWAAIEGRPLSLHYSLSKPRPEPHLDSVQIMPEKQQLPAHYIPLLNTSLIGREEDFKVLDTFLQKKETRLITIIGSGGIGKTCLMLETASRQLTAGNGAGPRFPDGVFFVSLGAVSEESGFLPAIFNALSLPISSQEERSEQQQLCDYLEPKRLLLALDNMEHLLDASNVVAEILKVAPQVKVLATSREALHLQQEQIYPLQGLDISPAVEKENSPAVSLFLQCARRARPDFDPAVPEFQSVDRLCRLVEGIPLAIELAASWISILSATEILDEIQHGLDMLTTRLRDIPERHRSLRAVFDASWEQLSQAEQEVFKQVSLFRGGFSHRAARQVCGTDITVLASLAEKSMLYYRRDRERFECHEVLRQYGLEKLILDEPLLFATSDRHSAYYLTALKERTADLQGKNRPETLDVIERDLENVLAAWHWAIEQHEFDRLAPAITPLGQFYWWRSRYHEGEHALQVLIKLLEKMDPAGRRDLVLALALAWQSRFGYVLGHGDQVSHLLDQCDALLTGPYLAGEDTRPEKAFVLYERGRLAQESNLWNAVNYQRQALNLYQDLDDLWGQAETQYALGLTALNLGDHAEAERQLKESMGLFRYLGDQAGLAATLAGLSRLEYLKGQIEESRRLIRESLVIYRQLGDRAGLALSLGRLSESHLMRAEYVEGHACIEECVALFNELGNKRQAAFWTTWIGAIINLMLGNYATIKAQMSANILLFREVNDQAGIAAAYRMLGIAALVEKEYLEAENYLRQAAVLHERIGQEDEKWRTTCLLGYVARNMNQPKKAKEMVFNCLKFAVNNRAYNPLVLSLPAIALLLLDDKRFERAIEVYSLAFTQPIISNSVYWEQVAGREIAAIARTLPESVVISAKEKGISGSIWTAAAALLEDLKVIGWNQD